MLGKQLRKHQSGMFGIRETTEEAFQYGREVLPNNPESTVVMMVLYNTLLEGCAQKLDNMSDSEVIREHFGIDIDNDPEGIDKLVAHLTCNDLEDDDELEGQGNDTSTES